MPNTDVYRRSLRSVRAWHGPESMQQVSPTDYAHDASLIGYYNATTLEEGSVLNFITNLAPHPIATTTGIGQYHSVESLTAGQYLRAFAASDVRFETIPSGDLGSGTANSSTFLRGDRTWATPAGSGDVVGPGLATDNAIARFDGTTGKLIKNSVGILDNAGALTGITVNANVVTAGQLALARGGTNADLSATGGGTGKLVRQDGAGAAFTVGQAVTNDITNSAVTLAKIANAAASSKLLGSGDAGAGAAYVELTLGTNLSMSGTTLNATGGGGNSFETIVTFPATESVVADSSTDTLTLAAGAQITITGTAASDQIGIAVDLSAVAQPLYFSGIGQTIRWTDGGTGFNLSIVAPASINAERTITLPDKTGTVCLTNPNSSQTFSGAQIIFGTSSAPRFDVTSTFNATITTNTTTAITLSDGNNITCGSTTGTKFGAGLNNKIGMYTQTPLFRQLLGSTPSLTSGLKKFGIFKSTDSGDPTIDQACDCDLQGGKLRGVSVIDSRGLKEDDSTTFVDGTTIAFKIANGTEVTLAADTLTFENGATDTGFNWATNAKLGFLVGATQEMILEADILTLEAGATDVGFGWGTSGQLDFRIATTAEMRLTADTLTFENGATDTALSWGTSAQLGFLVGATQEMTLAADGLTFEAGATDVGLGWGTSGQLNVTIGGNARAWFTESSSRGLLAFEAGTNDVTIGALAADTFGVQISSNNHLTVAVDTTTVRGYLVFTNGASYGGIKYASGQTGPDALASTDDTGLYYKFTQRAWAIHETNATGTATRFVERTGAAQTSTVTVGDATSPTDTSLLSTPLQLRNGSSTPRSIEVGRTYRIYAWGVYTTVASPTPPTLVMKVKYVGSSTVTLCATGSITLTAGSTNAMWQLEAVFTVRTLGNPGTIFCQGRFMPQLSTTTATVAAMSNGSTINIDTTADATLDLTAAWSSNVAGTTEISCTNAYWEIID